MFSYFFDYPKCSAESRIHDKIQVVPEDDSGEESIIREQLHLSKEFKHLFFEKKSATVPLFERFRKYQLYQSTFFDRDLEPEDIQRIHNVGFKLRFEDLFDNNYSKAKPLIPIPNCISESIYSSECEINQFPINDITTKKVISCMPRRNQSTSLLIEIEHIPSTHFSLTSENCIINHKQNFGDTCCTKDIPMDIVEYVITFNYTLKVVKLIILHTFYC